MEQKKQEDFKQEGPMTQLQAQVGGLEGPGELQVQSTIKGQILKSEVMDGHKKYIRSSRVKHAGSFSFYFFIRPHPIEWCHHVQGGFLPLSSLICMLSKHPTDNTYTYALPFF
jgi:hypothetical protein